VVDLAWHATVSGSLKK